MMNELLEWFHTLMPFFRAGWITTILIGIIMLGIAFFLKQDPERKVSPWVVGGIGLVMLISSSMQLIFSFL